jgi:PAS domain S-box-containing protein
MAKHDDLVAASASGGRDSLAFQGGVSPALVKDDHDRLLAALRAARMVSFEWDLATDVVVRSGNAEELFGPGATRDTGEAFLRQVHRRDREEISTAIQALTPAKPDYQVTYRYFRSSDGGDLVFEDRGRAEFDSTGRLVRLRGMTRDMAEQKRTETSEERYRRVVETAEEGIWALDTTARTTFANPKMAQMLGYSVQEMQGKHLFDFMYMEDKSLAEAKLACRQQGMCEQHEFRFRRKDGTEIWTLISTNPSFDDGGNYTGALAMVSEITERKRTEEALRESEERLRFAWQATRDVIWDWDVEKDQQRWSAGGADVFGWTDAIESLQTAAWWAERVHPQDRQRVTTRFHAAVADPACHQWQDEYRFLRKDGSVAEVLDRGYIIRDTSGKPKRMIGAMQDITARKQAEEALRETQQRLRRVLDAAGVGLWLNEMPFGTLAWDTRTRELFFVEPGDEPRIELFWSRLHPEDREATRRAVEKALRDRTLYAIDHRTVEPGTGRVRWIHSEGRGTYDASGKVVRFDGINYDITERKAFQEELERLVAERTAELRELVGELEHFSYSITHDMRAPLRAMMGFAEVAMELCSESRQDQQKVFLERIQTAARRMDLLITDALNYSKAVRNELPLAPVDVGRLLRGMVDTYPELQVVQGGIWIAPELPLVMGNEAGLTQCFSNLLVNAVKFVKPGEAPQIRVWAQEVQREECGVQRGWVRIWVEDRGIGIEPKLLPRVFAMFSRGTSKQAGTGIGLALVRKVVERMGGRVGVESEEGRGSRFWVELSSGGLGRDEAESVAGVG